MRIAQIVCTFPPYKGGMGNVAYKYAVIVGENGHLSKVLTPKYKTYSEDISPSFAVEKFKTFIRYGNAAFLPQIFFQLKKYDVIHFHYPFFGTDISLWLANILQGGSYKLVIHYHMDVLGLPFFLKPLTWPSKIILRSLMKRADLLMCGSLDYVAHSQIKNIYKKHKNKFKEIEFGVDVKRFFPLTRSVERENIILFVGGLDKAHYFKGLGRFIRTLKKLEDRNWSLKIIGSGDREDHYKKQVKELELDKRVKFLGNVSSDVLPKIYRESSLLVLPSINRNEAFGLVLLEAMASGIPVLASDLYGVRKVFDDRVQGLYFKTNDNDDLKKKLEWFCDNKEEAKRMGESGRRLVEKKYDWAIIEKKLLNVYENLCNQ